MNEFDQSDPIPFDPAHEDPLDDDPTTIAAINARFARGTARMLRFEEELRRNTEATKANGVALGENNAMTREMYEVWAMAKSGIEAFAKLGRGLATAGRWVAKAVKWLAPVVIGALAIWHALEALVHGGPPK